MGYIRNIFGFFQRSYSIYSRMAVHIYIYIHMLRNIFGSFKDHILFTPGWLYIYIYIHMCLYDSTCTYIWDEVHCFGYFGGPGMVLFGGSSALPLKLILQPVNLY